MAPPDLRHAGESFDALRTKLQANLGLSDDEYAAAVAAPDELGEEFMPHAKFLETRPEWQDTDEPCPGMLRVLDQSGVLWPCVCDLCGFEVGVQVQQIDPDRLTDYRLAKAGIPEMFASKQFEPSEQQDATLRACRAWIQRFKAEPLPALALWGDPGRGKSHLLSLICEGLIRKWGVDVLYRSANDLFDQLQAGFDEATYEAQWRRVLSVPVLALDDIGAGRRSEWRMERLAALVDHRYSKELPLLVATNVPPPGWEKAFGPRTKSRLGGMTVKLHLEGADRRAQGEQQTLAEATA